MDERDENSIAQFYPLARALATRMSPRPDEIDDLTQEGFVALLLALRQTPEPRDPSAFARTVLWRAIRGALKTLPPATISLDHVTPDVLSREDRECGLFILRGYLNDLEDAEGPLAARAARHLLTPDEDLGHLLLNEIQQKREENKETPGSRRGITHTVRLSHRHIRDIEEMTVYQWHQTLRTIRNFTTRWLRVEEGAA